MSELRAIYHIARADFLERVRRYSYLGTLALALYLAFLTAKGDLAVRLGDWRGQYNSAWFGMLFTLVATTFIPLAGFYIVSNSVKRDEKTRVGRILAATPMKRISYTTAKAISNFAVLASMALVLALAAVLMQVFRGEDPALDFSALLLPFVVFALPMMLVVAAIAIFFETTPVLRGSTGSVAYFFMWTMGIVACEKLRNFDLDGIGIYMRELTTSLRAADPTYKDGFVLGFDPHPATKLFVWHGTSWPVALLTGRLLWIAVALTLTAMASLWFHRFDPARERLKLGSSEKKQQAIEEYASVAIESAGHLTPMRDVTSGSWFAKMFVGELRLLIARQHWAVYAVALGLLIAGAFVPFEAARRGVLVAAWLFPAFALSRMGAREDLHSMRALIFSAPHAASRQLAASWLAAAALPLALGLGVAIRLAARADYRSVAALIAGALFMSAAALAIGNLTRTPKAFEAIFIGWWYAGPVNQIPGCDFIGTTTASVHPLQYAVLALVLIALAWAIRKMRLARA